MSSIPLLFKIAPGARHEVILLDTSGKPSLKALNKQITATIATSPNCAEFMGKFKNKETTESIQEIKVHWSSAGRDTKVWPEYTVVTEENWPALIQLLELGKGKDVLEIKVGKDE